MSILGNNGAIALLAWAVLILRADPIGRAAEPPHARLGVYVLVGGQAPDLPENREVRIVQPNASEAQRGQGICRSWPEVFNRVIEPCRDWIGRDQRVIVDFERVFGHSESYDAHGTLTGRVLSFEEELISRQRGLKHLSSGEFATAAKPYVAAGMEVVAHSGCPNTTDPRGHHWADDEIDQGRGAQVFRALVDTDAPLLEAGIRVGRDGMQLAQPGSFNERYYRFYQALGGLQQIEATPEFTNRHWKGEVFRIRWRLYEDRHVHGTIPGFPRIQTPQFAQLCPDVRVSVIPSDMGGDQLDSDPAAGRERWQRLIDTIRPGVTKILADAPNVTVLLHHSIIERAIDLNIPASEFMP
jgi:hypothetical protein